MTFMMLLSSALASTPVVAQGATVEVGPSERALVIEASSTRFDLESSKGWFTGSVKASRGDMSLTADEAEVTLGEGGEIARAVARGQVVVSQGAHQATGDVALIEGDTVTLSGDPVLTSPQHRMKGREMVFQVGAKTVRCTACTVVVQER